MPSKILQDLRGRLLASELEMSLTDNEIKRLELERTYFSAMSESREENLETLKQDGIICTLWAFRKSIEEVKFFREKLVNIDSYIEKKKKEMLEMEKNYTYYLKVFDEEYDKYKKETKILIFRKR